MSTEKETKRDIFLLVLTDQMCAREISQSELARMTGVLHGRISEIVHEKYRPGLKMQTKIAKAFGYELVDFLSLGRQNSLQELEKAPGITESRENKLLRRIDELSQRLCAKDDKIERLEAENVRLKEENERLKGISGDVEPLALQTRDTIAGAKDALGVALDD